MWVNVKTVVPRCRRPQQVVADLRLTFAGTSEESGALLSSRIMSPRIVAVLLVVAALSCGGPTAPSDVEACTGFTDWESSPYILP